MYARLEARLPKVSLVNLDDMMEKLRTVKSAEEIAILEKAAALGDLMLQACRDTARPGVKECEVYARMMEVMLANGGEEPTLFLWAADAHPYPHPFRVPTTRPLAKGDMNIDLFDPKWRNGETGCVFAETIVITDDGARRLHSFPTEFQRVAV